MLPRSRSAAASCSAWIARGVDLSTFRRTPPSQPAASASAARPRETVAPALVLAAALFVCHRRPALQPHDREASRVVLARGCRGGDVCSIVALVGFFLHDALFSLRPSELEESARLQHHGALQRVEVQLAGPLMLQPESFTSFARGAARRWPGVGEPAAGSAAAFVYAPSRHVPAHDGRRRLVRRARGQLHRHTIYCNPAAALAARRARDGARASLPSSAFPWLRVLIVSLLVAASPAAWGSGSAGRLRRVTVGWPSAARPSCCSGGMRSGARDRRHRGRPTSRYPGGGARSESIWWGATSNARAKRVSRPLTGGARGAARSNDLLFVSRNVHGGCHATTRDRIDTRASSFNVSLDHSPLTKDTWPAPPESRPTPSSASQNTNNGAPALGATRPRRAQRRPRGGRDLPARRLSRCADRVATMSLSADDLDRMLRQ